MALFQELKRRRVFNVAAVYGAVAFVLVQVADIAFPALLLPPWALTLVVVLLVIGFPIALVLAWAFELTPHGVRRTPRHAHAGDRGHAARTAIRRRNRPATLLVGGGLVVLAGLGVLLIASRPGARAALAAEPDRSIAVLPFENMSAEAENAFFASGIHDEIITQLSKIADLKVISRSSVVQYVQEGGELRRIGERLGVGAVLDGSVQRYGDARVRITARLTDARTNRHLWAERYDRDLSDIFAIQSEVALEIAAALRANLTVDERTRIQRRLTENLAAYDLYLRARELLGKTREEHESAIELLQQAIRLDPEFAAAHASLSLGYTSRVNNFGYPRSWIDSAMTAARTAVALDRDLPVAHNALASVFRQRGLLRDALASRQRAIDLDPNYATALAGLSIESRFLGRLDESLIAAVRAAALEPTSAFACQEAAVTAFYLGNLPEVQRWLEEGLRRDPGYYWSRMTLAYLALARGESQQAREALDRFVEIDPTQGFMGAQAAGDVALYLGDYHEAVRVYERQFRRSPDARHQATHISFRTMLAGALLHTGERERALSLAGESIAEAQRQLDRGHEHPGLRVEIALAQLVRGETDEALAWFERAIEAGWREHIVTRQMPGLRDLYDEPRFRRLFDRLDTDLEAQSARLRRNGVW